MQELLGISLEKHCHLKANSSLLQFDNFYKLTVILQCCFKICEMVFVVSGKLWLSILENFLMQDKNEDTWKDKLSKPVFSSFFSKFAICLVSYLRCYIIRQFSRHLDRVREYLHKQIHTECCKK